MDVNKLCIGCMKELVQPGICPHCGYNPQTVTEEGHYLKPYTILNGKYLVGKVLGEGGFGITYIGYDLNLEMPVAIKEFYPNGFVTRESSVTSLVSVYQGTNLEAVSKWKNNFIKEARTLAKCSHLAGIVGVKDFFEENGTAYIVMEYLQGMTLKAYAKSHGGKIDVNLLLRSLEPVMASLAKVHESGLIHRDISPDNIMLLEGGNMKLLDFGAARDYASEEEKSLSVMLKPGYAPEEQYRTKGKQGPWSDVYAFAATIYKCITGVTPPESMERMRNDELKKPSELGIAIDSQVEFALLKGMEVYAENRYRSMTEFMADIYRTKPAVSVSVQPALAEQAVPSHVQTIPSYTQTSRSPAQVEKVSTHMAVKSGKEDWIVIFQKNWKVIAAAGAVLVIVIAVFIARGDNADSAQTTATDTAITAEMEETTAGTEETTAESVVVTERLGEEEIEELVEESIENGKDKMNEGDYDAAMIYLEKARALDAEREEIYSLESDIYLQKDDVVSAVAILDEGIIQTNKITLDTRKNYILEHTTTVKVEKYQDDVLLQADYYDDIGNIEYQEVYDISGNLTESGEYYYENNRLNYEVHYSTNGRREVEYNYDGSVSWSTSVDQQGQGEASYYYYDNGMLSNIYYYAINDFIESDGCEWFKTFEYDQMGNQIKDVSFNIDGSMSSWQEYNYDTSGKMTKFAAFFSDGRLNVSGENVYDANGNKIESYECDANGKQTWREEYEYDALGNCVIGKHFDGGSDEVSYEWNYVWTYVYSGGVSQ